ncbi:MULTISPECIES: branched-chain amino acid ABC transporter permease [unclassified Actinotalea]|uniref:branched-chain amino acid ABC transporter permease n=1 Tax=unclassified Actinotalea TaxID=2638618 RepID=UPI0015F3F342|nr:MULTISPECIES: branched-chain amino acid ABC transporter permease [unclassified Actinotalea]
MLLVALLTTSVALLLAPAASAATGEACQPGTDRACVGGTIRTAAGEPAVGVALVVEGQGASAEATTNAEGRWSVAVTAAGAYTVTLDEATLPAGETLRDPTGNPRTVEVELGANRGALFPLGAPTAPAPGADDGGDGGDEGGDGETATAPPAPGGDEPGLDTPVPGTSTSGGVNWDRVAQQTVAGLVFGLLLALASVGLSLIFGTTGLSNFAHGEQVTLGGILAYVFTQLVGLPLLVSGALAVVLAAASGWLQDAAIWKPLRTKRVGMTQQLIVTIGLAITLQYVYQFFLGGSSLRIVRSNPATVTFGPVFITQQSLVSVGLAVLALGAVSYFLVGTRIGRATRAVSDNPALAAASGISVDRIIRLVWTLGAGLAGLGGVTMGLYLNATAWNMGSTLLLLMFAAVTLGGLGTAFGALVGSVVIGLVVELSNLVIPSDMRYAGALVILILVLLLRPQGILGRAERIG